MIVMTLNRAGWHLLGGKCIWKSILLIVLQMTLSVESFKQQRRAKKHAIYFSYRQPLFSFPAWVDTRKINLGVGVLVQDPLIVLTLNLAGWHLLGGKCVWKRILLIVLQMTLSVESFKQQRRAKKHAIYFSYRQPLFSFLPAWVGTRKINLGVGVLVQDPLIVMTLNLAGWHLQGGKCVWKRIFLIVLQMNLESF